MAHAPHDTLLQTLAERFARHPHRHAGIDWAAVQARLQACATKLAVLERMEASGGEPDLVGVDAASGAFVFCDCAAESPAGRRSLCFDSAALDARKAHRPAGSAIESAHSIGVSLLTEAQYRALQQLDEFDRKTSSWIVTPDEVRQRGGALFGDRRYGRVFIYHNGAESYYAARGFRGRLEV